MAKRKPPIKLSKTESMLIAKIITDNGPAIRQAMEETCGDYRLNIDATHALVVFSCGLTLGIGLGIRHNND